jgi:hypothetical protein
MRAHILIHVTGILADHFSDIAPQHGMPCLHCLFDTSRPGKARRNPAVSPPMGTTSVRMAVLLLHFRHPRV